MEIIVLNKSQDVYLLSTDSFVNDEQFLSDPHTQNCLLVKLEDAETFDGNYLVFLKYYPFEDLDQNKSQDYIDIIKQSFTGNSFYEKIVDRLFTLSNGVS